MLKPIQEVWLIGCGGVASYFLPPFLKYVNHATKEHPRIRLIDGDKLEDRNLDRQLFPAEHVGEFKSTAFANMFGESYRGKLTAYKTYFTPDHSLAHEGVVPDVIFCFADNHVARKVALEVADKLGTTCILGGNGQFDADAYIYKAGWKGVNDPRIRFPDILTDTTGNPVQAIGCASEQALDTTPQLAPANYMAAGYAMHLFVNWFETDFDGVDMEYRTILHSSNFNALTSATYKPDAAAITVHAAAA